VLGYATLALGEFERAENAYRALAEEYGLLPGDLLAPARADLAKSKLPGAAKMLALLAAPKVDAEEAATFWSSLDDDLRALLRANLGSAPKKGELTGKWIEGAYMLETLALEKPVKKLAPIARMPRLARLSIRSALPMLPFREIAKLVALRSLKIEGDCDLRDLDFVAGLEKLETLIVFESNAITDLACLARLNELKFLQLGDGQVRDLRFLRGKTKLEHLILSVDESVTDFSVLAELPALQVLDLRATGMRSLAPLAGASKLQRVQLHASDFVGDCEVRSLAGLERKPELSWVEVERAPDLDDISALAGATQLRRLVLNEAPKIADFTSLAGLAKLDHLELYGARALADLGVLGAKPDVTSLEITYSSVVDLAPLAKWKALESLSYYHTSAKKKLRGIGKLLDLELSIDPDDFEPAEAKKLSRLRPARE
jgi:hypothetical protein